MGETLYGMLTVIACWTIWSAAFVGFGLIGERFFRPPAVQLSFTRFWTGLALVTFFLQIWHLFLPVDWKASAVVLLIGFAGIGSRFKGALGCLADLSRRRFLLLSVSALALWVANISLRAPWNYDSGLYHFQMIRWLNEYAIVPGLGNLHMRLAFNQSYFLYPALLNVSPFFLKGYQAANSLLFLALVGQLLFRSINPLIGSAELRIFSILMSAMVVKQGLRESLSSPSPDFAIFIFGVVIVLWLVECLVYYRGRTALDRSTFAAVLLVACCGVTFKLSFLAVALSVGTLLLWLVWKTSETGPSALIASAAAICISFLAVWAARGVIISGYPLFPMTFAGMELDWRVPAPQANETARLVYSWARKRGESPERVLNDSTWLKSWINKNARNANVNRPILLFVICLGALPCLHYAYRSKSVLSGLSLLPLAPPTLWLLFWFLTAPDPRFASAAFNLLAAWSATLLLVQLWAICRWNQPWLIRASVVIAILLVAPRVIKNGAPTMCIGAIPAPPLEQVTTRSGLILYVPRTNDQAWNAPLPSAPFTNPSLETRSKILQDGFRSGR